MRAGLHFIGEVLDVTTFDRHSERTGNKWTETTIHVLAGRKVERVRTAGDHFQGDLPTKGDQVVLEVSVDTYVNKSQQAAYSLTAWRVAESSAPEPVKS